MFQSDKNNTFRKVVNRVTSVLSVLIIQSCMVKFEHAKYGARIISVRAFFLLSGEVILDYSKASTILEAHRVYCGAQETLLLDTFKTYLRRAEKKKRMGTPATSRRSHGGHYVLLDDELRTVESSRRAELPQPVRDTT